MRDCRTRPDLGTPRMSEPRSAPLPRTRYTTTALPLLAGRREHLAQRCRALPLRPRQDEVMRAAPRHDDPCLAVENLTPTASPRRTWLCVSTPPARPHSCLTSSDLTLRCTFPPHKDMTALPDLAQCTRTRVAILTYRASTNLAVRTKVCRDCLTGPSLSVHREAYAASPFPELHQHDTPGHARTGLPDLGRPYHSAKGHTFAASPSPGTPPHDMNRLASADVPSLVFPDPEAPGLPVHASQRNRGAAPDDAGSSLGSLAATSQIRPGETMGNLALTARPSRAFLTIDALAATPSVHDRANEMPSQATTAESSLTVRSRPRRD
jgi:hypothetical protein